MHIFVHILLLLISATPEPLMGALCGRVTMIVMLLTHFAPVADKPIVYTAQPGACYLFIKKMLLAVFSVIKLQMAYVI